MNKFKYFLVVQLLFSVSLCEINNGQGEKLLNGFLKYYNSLPNQVYQSEEGSLHSTQQVDDTTYQIEANLRVSEISNSLAKKGLKCIASVKDSGNEVTVLDSHCEEAVEQKQSSDGKPETSLDARVEVSEPTVERKPVQLVNEVQPDTAITSGEQFIAIPRDQPSAPCVGCASHVNPQAAGVSDLADLGVRHLDLHEPSVKHSLASVIDVERQVQVVNGVRYILILSINSNKCTQVEVENCASSKICKITILVKPWVKLSNGGNYRAILANNCTEEWQFGDNGEVLPELSTDDNQDKGNTSGDPGDINAFDGDIQVKHYTNDQSQPNQERSLTDDDIKKIQEQIITDSQFHEVTESNRQSFTISPDVSDVSKQHVFKVESDKPNENSIPVTEPAKTEKQAFKLNLDKKKAIDEMLDFFDFSGFKPKTVVEDVVPRVKRSYDYDLQVLSLAEDFHGIKNSIENARFMYEMAQAMVDYMNEMDMEVKNRAVKNVIRAEEEKENLQRFIYIQARVTIPCDKVECESRDVDTQICNGVIDCSNENSPQILSTFCYNDNKESDYRQDIREVSLNDPVLRRLAEEAVNKIESESKSQYAMRINKIASAITQVTSGTLTKFSVIVENIKCNKSVPLPLRINCTVLEQLGSKICDIIVHERHWLKEKKMSYSCTDRPADVRISKSKKVSKNVTVDDPRIIEMLQEAIQYLESQSDKTNKQKIVNIKSISSQIIAGFLTKIEFVVGYTDCTDENYSRDQINKCELLKGEGLRSCKAQIWDRSWIMDGRQIEVSCDDVLKNNEIVNTRRKRSIDSPKDQEQQILSKNNDLDYKQLANESLYRFMRSSSSNQHYEVVNIDKSIVQDVSRKLIRIDFSISPTNCLIQNNGILSSSECNIVNPKNILHCRSKILENNWIDKKQYFVKCNIKYQQQKNTNSLKERNPSDSKYYMLAAESLIKYLHDTGIPQHTIVRVEKVTTQIVSGLLTRIDFIVSPKNLSISNSKYVRCHSEILEKHWMGTKTFNVSCQMKQDVKKMDNTVEIIVDNPKYMQIAVEALQKYIKNKPESNLVRVAFVDKVERKGEKLKIRFIASHDEEVDGDTLCYAEVSETRESKSDIEVKCHSIGKLYRKVDIAEDDPNYYKYVQMADESLRNYLQKMNSSLYTVVTIENVAVLWDEGIKTVINFTISPIDTESSDLLHGKQCIAEILEQPWLQNSYKKNIDVQCKLDKDLYRTKRGAPNDRFRRQLGNKLGGRMDQDPTGPQYKALAEESLQKYTTDHGITHPLIVTQVEKVSTQVVAGSLTRIDFLVSGSSDSKIIKCHSAIWEKRWQNFKEITVTCENDGHRGKRQVAGGRLDKDPTDPQYKALAEESLQKYTIDHGITQTLIVAQVEKVSTQVVAGSLTRIDFLVSGSSDSKIIKCHSEIWEKGWENFKQITVTCTPVNERVKRDLGSLSGALEENLRTPRYKVLTVEAIRGNSSNKGKQPVSTLRGHIDEEQDPTKPEYKRIAEESLRKLYHNKSTVYHKVLEVQHVLTRVVSGLKYKIDFTAAPTACSVNVSSVRAHSCKAVDGVVLYCHTDVWDRPWLKQKKIEVQCNGNYESNDFAEDGSDKDLSSKPSETQKTNFEKYTQLAEEASEKYLTTSNRKYVHKVTEIVSASEHVTNGTRINIDYTLSPTTCLRNETTNNTLCKLKQPLVVFNCNANILVRQGLQVEKEIKVSCKKTSETNSKKRKRESGVRNIREIDDDDDEIDEDTAYYYADRAVQHINDRSNSNNLHKLISIYAVKNSVQMGTLTVRMYIELAETFCLRHYKTTDLRNCEEMNGLAHKLCLARLWPSPDDELVVRHVSVVCDNEEDFMQITGVNILELVKISLAVLEGPPENKFKLVHQGEPQLIPSLDSRRPFKLNFVVAVTNCSKDVNLDNNPFQCYLSPSIPPRNCYSLIWLKPEAKYISNVDAQCTPIGRGRVKRSTLDPENVTLDYSEIQNMVTASLEQLEMQSLHRYKQRVLQINSHSTKITSGKVTTIDFDVGYTSCLKYEWVANITSCNFLEHLPRRRCVAQIWQRLWINNGKNIDVNCVDDETPLESHIEFESAEMANDLARQALKHIEAKYPHPSKQKVVRIFSLEKQVVAGIHYKMKIEVGFTDCLALSDQKECKLVENHGLNKFCRVNVWIRPWTDHPPNFRVSCDFQEGTTHDLYHHVQAEHLFYNFLTTYSPSYVNDYSQMHKRFEIFKNNIKKIHEFNVHEKGTAMYGVTRFSDLTYEEFSTTYMGLKPNLTSENQVPMKQADIPNVKVPDNFDWREYDAVTEVKDQGSCGSCWAFSVTGNIEGQWKMQSGQLVSLSEQELVDCDKLDDGCNGGLPDNAYRAIEQMGGLELESDYPYEGTDDKCLFNKTLAKVKINSAVNITKNETGMAQWLLHNGPISIGINANAMQFYMGGISHPWKMLCNPTNLDHGVLIVGYGVKDYPLFHKKLPYWIVKNSWGKSWGEQGYYRVYRGDGTCGVNQMASSAVI